ncbi:MAG: NADH-quinone oxidoreductase subunit 5 family protein [Nocardioidaceae bacterium]
MTALAMVIVLPALSALATILIGRRLAVAGAWTATVGLALTWLLALTVAIPVLRDHSSRSTSWGGPAQTIGVSFTLYADSLSAAVLLLSTTVGTLVAAYSIAYLQGDPRLRSYSALVALFVGAMDTVVVADNLWLLLVGWEVMGACSYLLIGHHWELAAARDGALKALLMTVIGDLGLLLAVLVLGEWANTYQIGAVITATADGHVGASAVSAACALIVLAAVGKSAQFPLATWLPDAMAGPTPISALIHAATMVAAGVYVIARLYPLFLVSGGALALLAVIAAVTMTASAAIALAQDDLKRVLAWSTVSQLAYMFGGLAVGGYTASVWHLLSHGAFKALLFLAAGSIAHAVGSTELGAMGGLRHGMRLTFVTMTIGFAALAGLVPTAGFFSKDAILDSALTAARGDGPGPTWTGWLVLVAGLVTVALTSAYAVRAWLLVFFGAQRPDAHEPSALMRWPLVILAIPSLLLGVLVLSPGWLSLGAHGHVDVGLALGTTALVLAAGAATWARWRGAGGDGIDPAVALGRLRPVLAGALGIDTLIGWAIVRPVEYAADIAVTADTDVVDAYPRGIGVSAGALSWLARRAQSGNAQTYVSVVVIGLLLLVAVATGTSR